MSVQIYNLKLRPLLTLRSQATVITINKSIEIRL